MKELFRIHFLLIAFMMMLSVTAFAQETIDSSTIAFRSSCQSKWIHYSNPTEKYSIVRSNSNNHVIYIKEKEKVNVQIRHTFIVKDNKNSSVFTTSFVPKPFTWVEISDMRLFEDTCYFCGKYVTYFPIVRLPYTKGFVGRFVTKEILKDSGSVYYFIVDTTTELTRLAISKTQGAPLLISAIGTRTISGMPCIVELKNNGSVWKKNFDTISNTNNLVFSDIMTMSDSITLLAQYDCANDNLPGSNDYDNAHQIFLLDRYSLKGCYQTYSLSGIYSMALYVMGIGENHYFHYGRAPMRLFHYNVDNSEFGVAFGVEEADGSDGGIRLFTFHNAWQYDNCLYFRTGEQAELRDIGNKYSTNIVYVLSRDNTHTNGLITLPTMGGTNNVTWLTNDTYTFNSLTQIFAADHMDISGHNVSFDFLLFSQNLNNLSLPTCFNRDVYQYENLSERRASPQYMNWKFTDEKPVEWQQAEINKIELETDVICEKCN